MAARCACALNQQARALGPNKACQKLIMLALGKALTACSHD